MFWHLSYIRLIAHLTTFITIIMVHVQFIPELHENIFMFLMPSPCGAMSLCAPTMPLLRAIVLEELNINIDIYLN